MRRLLLCYAAGSFGGLLNSIVVWSFGEFGISKQLGVSITPNFSADWLYLRLVWGGIWGLLFVFPLLKSKLLLRGLVFSFGPSAVQLLYIFPVQNNKGMGGVELGLLTPLLVLFFNWVWGISTASALKLSK